MLRFKDQRYAIKFCVELTKRGSETVAIPREAYRNNIMSQNVVYRWHKLLWKGREDKDSSRCPLASQTDQNRNAIWQCYPSHRTNPDLAPDVNFFSPKNEDVIHGSPFLDFRSRQRSDNEILEEGPCRRLPRCVQRRGKILLPVCG
ncbi:hypothetical protein NPIL_466101 [Nephila pilipes]|uniref:Mos1 transposase HTH domain-containing protein n=1 Tax=Nephila pilipes TaxID=299642 RepID=A0A8X6U3F8_NEPPI|nr:hypothetical protein NPIL_466101 [Nephila pilipes]